MTAPYSFRVMCESMSFTGHFLFLKCVKAWCCVARALVERLRVACRCCARLVVACVREGACLRTEMQGT